MDKGGAKGPKVRSDQGEKFARDILSREPENPQERLVMFHRESVLRLYGTIAERIGIFKAASDDIAVVPNQPKLPYNLPMVL